MCYIVLNTYVCVFKPVCPPAYSQCVDFLSVGVEVCQFKWPPGIPFYGYYYLTQSSLSEIYLIPVFHKDKQCFHKHHDLCICMYLFGYLRTYTQNQTCQFKECEDLTLIPKSLIFQFLLLPITFHQLYFDIHSSTP